MRCSNQQAFSSLGGSGKAPNEPARYAAASGHINQLSPFLCNLQQHLIRLADEMAEALYHEQDPTFLQRFYGAAK